MQCEASSTARIHAMSIVWGLMNACRAGALVTDNTPEAREASRHIISLVHTAFDCELVRATSKSGLGSSSSPSKASSCLLANGALQNAKGAALGPLLSEGEKPGDEIQAHRGAGDGKENCEVEADPESAWASFCNRSLAPAVAAAVLKVSS